MHGPGSGKSAGIPVHLDAAATGEDFNLAGPAGLASDMEVDPVHHSGAGARLDPGDILRNRSQISPEVVDRIPVAEVVGDVVLVHFDPHRLGLVPQKPCDIRVLGQILNQRLGVYLRWEAVSGYVAEL